MTDWEFEGIMGDTIQSRYDAVMWWSLGADGGWHRIIRNIDDVPEMVAELRGMIEGQVVA